MHPSELEWGAFYAELKKRTGIDLYLYKADQMRRRILSMAGTKGCATLAEFGSRIGKDPAEMRWFLDKMAINVTELFRNPEKWDELRTKILPDLLTRTSKLKCWSAGCSIGAEATTLAVLFEEHFPGGHTVLGTDIDDGALQQAERGDYSAQDMRGVSAAIRDKYFEAKEDRWITRPSLRRHLTYRKGNLLADRFEGGFDLILCRNVVIYFTNDAKDALYEKFYQALRPGGYLFVGSTERIFNSKDLGFDSPVPFFYQRPKQGDNQWRNAS